MQPYRPPLGDIRFVLNHVANLSGLSSMERFAHADAETVLGLLDESGRFTSEVVAPLSRTGDQEGSRLQHGGEVETPTGYKDAYKRFVEAGWGGISFDPEYGGGGLPWVLGLAVQEMLTEADVAFSLCPMLTQGAVEAISFHGSEELKGTYLENLISGRWTGTMSLTEPQAGSDVGALATKAVPAGDRSWKVTGTKIFITWGEHDMAENIIHLVLARTPGSPLGTRGVSLFIVPKYLVEDDGGVGERNDVRCVSIEHKLGIHASPTCVLAFGDEEGAVGYLVGEENEGMSCMFTMMNNARIMVGVQGLAVAERSYQAALAFATERRQGRAVGAQSQGQSPIADHPDVQRMLLTMRANVEAMRCLLYFAAHAVDLGHAHPEERTRKENSDLASLLTPIVKAWCTDLGVEMSSVGLQVHGGMGYVEETGPAQLFRDSRIAPIYEGTNGIQAIDLVMRRLPLDGGKVVERLLRRVQATVDELEQQEALETLHKGLEDALAALVEATQWLTANRDAPNDLLAGATPYLRMFGTVLGGWLLARSALAVSGSSEESSATKTATASFYVEQILPPAQALLPSITAGAAALQPS